MKHQLIPRALGLCVVTALTMLMTLSCNDLKEEAGTWDDSVIGTATVKGTVMDTFDNLLADVDVTFMGTNAQREVRKTAKTGADGSFSVAEVPSNARFITFAKQGFATVAYTLEAARFTEGGTIEINPRLEFSEAVIKGYVFNAADGKPLPGVQVSNGVISVTTGEDGSFALEGLTLKDYTLTYSTADGSSYTKKVKLSEFIDGTATVSTVRLGGGFVFPSLTWQQAADAEVWYGNNYRGSTGFGGINDWSCGYMSAWQSYGHYRYEAEGCALVTHGGYGKRGDGDNFNAFFYGRKHIDEGNKIMSTLVRTHSATAADPIHFDVQVLNITDGAVKPEKIGEKTHGDGNYSSYSFDLSKFVGKDVVIALGIYYTQAGGDYHLPVRRVCFAPSAVSGDDALPGTPVEGANWRCFTKENLTSMTVNEKTSFTGMNLGLNSNLNIDGGGQPDVKSARRKHNPWSQQGYNMWTGTNHLAVNWTLQYVNKVVEPINGEGYTIKTRSGIDANYNTPESYLYNRFSITDANDKLHLRVRTFSSTAPTVFRVTVVPVATCQAKALDPVSNTARSASATENGCWQFLHESGAGDPKDYAEFVYDLSAYKGQDVVIALGVYKGATRDGEQKLCIYGIEMD